MDQTINHISKVEIKGLWGKFDFEWNLHEDVNVLSGINGSGKSTILKCISTLVASTDAINKSQIDEVGSCIESCKIHFNNSNYFLFEFVGFKDSSRIKQIERKYTPYEIKYNFTELWGSNFTMYVSPNTWNEDLLRVDVVSTFDIELKEAEAIKKLSDETVKTELDWEIYNLQKKYLDYQLNIGKRFSAAVKNNNADIDVLTIEATKERFLDVVDLLFRKTNKKINRLENEISFLLGEEKISPYQLSSGEKQILVILLTVLVQDNKPSILFLDEPEISLHFDWQKKLIGYIRELNPNVQIILATHAPAIIMEGWRDKVSNVSDMVKPVSKL